MDHEQSARAAVKTARMWASKRGLVVEAELPGPREPFGTPWVLRFRAAGEVRVGG